MENKISKGNIVEIAHNAVFSIRRFVSSGFESFTPLQQDLLSDSKEIVDQWQKKQTSGNFSDIIKSWAAGLSDELAFQLNAGGDDQTRKPLPSSTMIIVLEAGRTVSRLMGADGYDIFIDYNILPLLTQFFMKIPMSKKLREICALMLVEFPGDHVATMDAMIEASMSFLSFSNTASITAVGVKKIKEEAVNADLDTMGKEPVLSVSSVAMYLVGILVAALHRADKLSNGVAYGSDIAEHRTRQTITLLESAYHVRCAPSVAWCSLTNVPPLFDNPCRTGVCVMYLALISGLLRGNDACKHVITSSYGREFSTVWTYAVATMANMDTVLTVPLIAPNKDASFFLGPVKTWQSELLELLLELCTEGSFALCRLSLSNSTSNVVPPHGHDKGVSQNGGAVSNELSMAGGSNVFVLDLTHYDPIPTHWDVILTEGSQMMWRLASALYCCIFTRQGVDVLEECLLSLDTSSLNAESMFRSLLATMMLLCVSNPHNIKCLADRRMFECLFSLITHQQQSVFPSLVHMHQTEVGQVNTDKHSRTPISPVSMQQRTSTTRLTKSFICSLASLYFPKNILLLLMQGVEAMRTMPSCPTDADITESLLYALSCTYIPPRVLFFAGTGSVSYRVHHFAGRWTGYSFSAWIYPICIWAEGNLIFAFTEQSGTSVTISVAANGRTCCFVLRVITAKGSAISVVPESHFPAEAWSHFVFTHGLSGFIFYINERKLNVPLSVPFPKEPSKRHQLQLSFGGAKNESSFFGFVACMDMLDGAISEKDVIKLYSNGLRGSSTAEFRPLLSVRAVANTHEDEQSDDDSETLLTHGLPISVEGILFGKCESVSVHGVLSFAVPSVLNIFQGCGVIPWALRTLKACRDVPNFSTIAKLCLRFVATAMRLTNSDAELNEVLKDNCLDAVKAEVLTWPNIVTDFPSIMLFAATPRDGGHVLRSHPSSQAILSMLLEPLEVMCRRPGSVRDVRSCFSIYSILRELSDCLAYSENIKHFKAVPQYFERILSLTLDLSPVCTEVAVMLIEKLCKGQPEMELTLRFLVLPHPSKPEADVAKTEILRMLFDVARANVAMCDLIANSFKGCGVSYIILLINGTNHGTEAIRVFALRLLSLMLHVNHKLSESFVKSYGFEVLSLAIINSTSAVPIRLPTLDCLFQMAFDAYRPTSNLNETLSTRFSSSKMKTPTRSMQTSNTGVVEKNLGLPGHLPGLISRRHKVIHREYSFDMTHGTAKADDRLKFDHSYHSTSTPSNNLHRPPAFETALRVLGSLFISFSKNITRSRSNFDIEDQENASDGGALLPNATSVTTSITPPFEEEELERVVVLVLIYLEKIADSSGIVQTLLPYPWLEWLWNAVKPVVISYRNIPSGSPGCSAVRLSKKLCSTVIMHTRNIIRKMIVLDMRLNSKSQTLRGVRSGGFAHSSYLTYMVLEEVVRHFSKCELSDLRNASNVIKNLNYLLLNVEGLLDPFPTSLGIEIVTAINAIAVHNNSWVRMCMKNSTNLFGTRDSFAFYLLVTAKRFSRLHMELLTQLLEANAHNLNAACILLYRFTIAMAKKNFDELEIVLLLIHQLATTYEDQQQEIYKLLGATCTTLADLLCTICEDGDPLYDYQSANDPLPTREETSQHNSQTFLREASSGFIICASSTDSILHSLGAGAHNLPTSQIISWCDANKAKWDSLTQDLHQMASKIIKTVLQSSCDRCGKEKAAALRWLKTNRKEQGHYDQVMNKANQELKRIRAETEIVSLALEM